MSLVNDPIYESYTLGPHKVPGYWQFLLPKVVQAYRLPSERRATCANCPMIAARGFRPDYRCCTYLPLVPGFAVGLAMQQGRARERLELLISQGFMTPEGLVPSPLARFHFKRQDALGLYGKGETLCHLLDPTTGHCGIYAFRNGVCSTFFCIHDHGDVGDEFWGSLRDLVCHLETAVQQWALREVGFDVQRYMTALDALADAPLAASDTQTRAWHGDVLAGLWGEWRGREATLFLSLADLVKQHRGELARIAERQTVIEPMIFEAALRKITDDDLFASDDRPTVPGDPSTKAQIALLSDLEDALWRLPDLDLPLSLHPAVSIDQQACRLRFDMQDDYWELDLSEVETQALLFFSVPHSLRAALAGNAALNALPNPTAFVAEHLACQVLYNFAE